jgi:hypothetical protein
MFYSYVDSFLKVFETNHNRLGWMLYANKNDNYYFFIDMERQILNFILFDILYNSYVMDVKHQSINESKL